MNWDILISGAGPAGLCLAIALADSDLKIALIEQQTSENLENAPFDGREIALTQRSASLLKKLGVWQQIEKINPAAFSPLKNARILNDVNPLALVIGHELTKCDELGWLVSNHLIRQAAFAQLKIVMQRHKNITLLDSSSVIKASCGVDSAKVVLKDGQEHSAKLLIAADSRFSTTRRTVGIGATQHDFGRTMLVCQMTHDAPHHHEAWQWFDNGQTLALLPMNPEPKSGNYRSSVVLTLAQQEITRLLDLEEEKFNIEMTNRFHGRLGNMHLESKRCSWPLVGVYPHQMVADRFACVGDAAVGMHPVTAHGFNFGLLGIETLSGLINKAAASGADFSEYKLLRQYERRHKFATRPLYEITRNLANLYSNDSKTANIIRGAAIQIGQKISPFKRLIAASLTDGVH